MEPRVELIMPPGNLKAKVPVTANGVDADMIERAEQIIVNLKDKYLDWVEEDLERLQRSMLATEALVGGPAEPLAAAYHQVYEIAHDMKGQGGSFNYPLVTVVGDRLCRFLEKAWTAPKDSQVPVIRVCVDALRLIITQRIEGDGGPVGSNLLGGLEAAIAKNMPAAP